MIDFDFIRENWLFIAAGAGQTLLIALLSFILAAPLAYVVALLRRSASIPLKALGHLYFGLIDGIPLVLLVFFLFLALPQVGVFLPGLLAAILVLAIYYSAAMSEIFIPGAIEAGEGLIISPAPAWAHQFTNIIKDSAIISVTGFVHEIMWRATRVGRAEFKNLEALLVAAIIYLVLISLISAAARLPKPARRAEVV